MSRKMTAKDVWELYKSMARPKKIISMKEEKAKQEEAVEKSNAKYDTEVKKLKELYAKRDETRRKTLLDAIEKSSNPYEEIRAFVTARQED